MAQCAIESAFYFRHGLLYEPWVIAILNRDQEGEWNYTSSSKRQRDQLRCKFLAERRNMAAGDRESHIFQTMDKRHEDLKRYAEMARDGSTLPNPKFRSGQSVLQWWASWMKPVQETPKKYNKKNRPAWFSAESCSFKEYGTIRYAGQEVTDNLYNVY